MRQAIYPLSRYTGFMILICVLNLSCTSNTEPNAPASAHSLTWNLNGTTVVADEADAYALSSTIIAEKNISTPATFKHLEILLAGLPGPGYVVGTYSLTAGGGNVLNYWESGGPASTWYSISGSLNITSKVGSIISGNFNAVLNGANGTISGTFTNLSIQ